MNKENSSPGAKNSGGSYEKTILIVFIFAIFLSIVVDSYNPSNKTNEVDGKKEEIEIYSHEDLATLPLEKTYV